MRDKLEAAASVIRTHAHLAGATVNGNLYPTLVKDVHDGDTFTVDATPLAAGVILASGPVRVLGINAPELGTAAGKDALAYAKPLLDGRLVALSFAEQRLGRDKYGRYLCRVLLPDGEDFAALMLASNHAVVDVGLRGAWGAA